MWSNGARKMYNFAIIYKSRYRYLRAFVNVWNIIRRRRENDDVNRERFIPILNRSVAYKISGRYVDDASKRTATFDWFHIGYNNSVREGVMLLPSSLVFPSTDYGVRRQYRRRTAATSLPILIIARSSNVISASRLTLKILSADIFRVFFL